MFFGLIMVATKHGKPKTGKDSIWIALISTAITTGLLLWGGFFKVFVIK